MTSKIAVICGTVDESTIKIAARMATILQQKEHTVEIYEAEKLPESFQVEAYDGVIVGAAAVDNEFPMAVNRMVRRHRAQLHEMPSAFYSVMSADGGEEQAQEQILEFAERTQWQPVVVASFRDGAGGFLKRMNLAATGRRRMGAIDPSKDYQSVDPANLDGFIEQLEEFMEAAREYRDFGMRPSAG